MTGKLVTRNISISYSWGFHFIMITSFVLLANWYWMGTWSDWNTS